MSVPQRSLCWLLCKALLPMVISKEPLCTNTVPLKLCMTTLPSNTCTHHASVCLALALPESVHSSGTDSAHSVSEGQVVNSDGELVEEGDCPTTDEDSEMDSDSEVFWAKSARRTWGLGHTFGNKLYVSQDIPEEKWIPKNLVAPTIPTPSDSSHGWTPLPTTTYWRILCRIHGRSVACLRPPKDLG